MSKEIFYLARGNIVGGHKVFRTPPVKELRMSDLSVHWSGDFLCHMHGLEMIFTKLAMMPASCIKIEVEEEGDEISIKVLDRNVECETSYH